MNQILEAALNSGLFAALFVFLLFYVLRDSNRREKKYQETIKKLSEHLDIIHGVRSDLADLKKEVKKNAARTKPEK